MTTETHVPSPEAQLAQEQPAPKLPAMQELARDPATGDPIVSHGHYATKDFGEVVGAIAAVMADLHPVEKGGTNKFHDYKYARMQDILQMLTPLMGKHGLVVFQYERRHQMFDDGKVMAITYDFIVAHRSGQTWINPVPQTGMSPCRTSKNTFDDKSTAKCHTSARKYFLLSLFQIPTEDENDPDNEKAKRADKPVPSPDGRMPPHLIEPSSRDTFDTWGERYLAGVRTSKTVADLEQWDALNDTPLSQMDADAKGKAVYDRILKECEAIRARLAPASAQQEATSVQQSTETKFVRPAGCPDADAFPDSFLKWAESALEKCESTEQLDIYWHEVIDPASDGLTPPDYSELQGMLRKSEKRLGG